MEYLKQEQINESFWEGVGRRMRTSRKKSNMTQAQIAIQAHCTRENISNYERGVQSIPADVIRVYSKVCKVSYEYLMDDNELSDGDFLKLYNSLSMKARRIVMSNMKIMKEENV